MTRDVPDEQMDHLETHLYSLIAQLRGLRNSYQPINRLPPELLVLIFRECQPRLPSFIPPSLSSAAYPHKSSHLDWWKLPSICRAWRGVLATNRSLWSVIDTSCNPETSLRRVAGYNLTIYLGLRGGVIEPSLMADISTRMDKVQELHVNSHMWTHPSSLCSYLSKPAPELVSLSLYLQHGPLPDFFSGQTPRLRQVSLTMECAYTPNLPTFSNLTHLFLCFKMQLNVPDTSELLDCLERSPLLEELALADLQTGNRTSVPPERIVHLNHLRKLDIGNWHSTRTARFLTHVHIPNATDVFIWCLDIDDTFKANENIASLLPLSDLTSLPWLTSVKSLSITWLPSSNLRRSWPHYKYHFVAVTNGTLHIHSLYPSQINPGLPLYPLSQIQTLIVQDATQTINDIRWRDILSRMGSLRRINILGWRLPQFTRSILSALLPTSSSATRTLETAPQFMTIHCPRLVEIYLEAESSPPVFILRTLVEERAERNAALGRLHVVLYRERKLLLLRPRRSMHPREEEELSELEKLENEEMMNRHEEEDVLALGTFVRNVKFDGDPEKVFEMLPPSWPTAAYEWYSQNP